MKFPEKKTAPAKSKREKTETGYILDGKEYRTHFATSAELRQFMFEKTHGKVIVAMSCGKDSLCATLELKKDGFDVVLIYLDRFPDILDFVQHSLEYYEDYFGQPIHRMWHPDLLAYLRNGIYQPAAMSEAITRLNILPVSYDDVWQLVRDGAKLPDAFTAIGETTSDNNMRRIAIKTHGAINYTKRTFFPIFDYKKEQILQTLRDAKIKLPPDYRLYRNTLDGIDARYMIPLKEHYPEDYERVIKCFPLIEADIFRMEMRKKYWEEHAI
jgi:predicted phosphoadenosine phosphosulfate sulfurtransferase